MTKSELAKLRKAIYLFGTDDGFEDAMNILSELGKIKYIDLRKMTNPKILNIWELNKPEVKNND